MEDILLNLVELRKLNIVGIKVELTNSQSKNFLIIRDIWKRFNSKLRELNYREKGRWEKFAITFRDNNILYYMPSIKKPENIDVPDCMTTKEIKEGKYIKFEHKGPMADLKITIQHIYKNILPRQSLLIETEEKAGLIHFERYNYKFKWDDPSSIIELYLPLHTTQDTQLEFIF